GFGRSCAGSHAVAQSPGRPALEPADSIFRSNARHWEYCKQHYLDLTDQETTNAAGQRRAATPALVTRVLMEASLPPARCASPARSPEQVPPPSAPQTCSARVAPPASPCVHVRSTGSPGGSDLPPQRNSRKCYALVGPAPPPRSSLTVLR